MVKGLEKLLKTTRNIFLASAIGISSLFANDSRIELVNYAEPTIPRPKVYTEIHSKLPEELRKNVIDLFEDIVPYYLKTCVKDGWKDECNKLLFDKIPHTISRIITSEIKNNRIDNNQTLDEHLESWSRNFTKNLDNWPFKDYGYIFIGTSDIFTEKNECNYGKIDIETTMLDDSWVEHGLKEKKERTVILYHDILDYNTSFLEFPPLGFIKDNIIYINRKRIEEEIDENVRESIETINEITLYKLNPSTATFSNLLNLFHPIYNLREIKEFEFKMGEEGVESNDLKRYMDIYERYKKDKDYREKIIKERIEGIFRHEADHIHQNERILSNCSNNKDFVNKSNFDELRSRLELLSYLSELAYAPNYIEIDNKLFCEIFCNPIYQNALYKLTNLYGKELNQPDFNLKDLSKMELNEIKNLSKKIFINNFNELSNFNGCKIY